MAPGSAGAAALAPIAVMAGSGLCIPARVFMARHCRPAPGLGSYEAMTNAAQGQAAEDLACAALTRDGFTLLARRARTPAGEIDIVAATLGLLVFVEVKQRATLSAAAAALGPRQKARLLAAAECLLAAHPDWAREAIRFDVLLVDAGGRIRRVADAFGVER